MSVELTNYLRHSSMNLGLRWNVTILDLRYFHIAISSFRQSHRDRVLIHLLYGRVAIFLEILPLCVSKNK